MEIAGLNRDTDRAEVEAFFARNIADGQARVPILPRANDPHRGYQSHILAIREAGDVIAALYAGPPVLEVAEMTMLRRLPMGIGETALTEFVMLYDVATGRDHRRKGLAGALVDELESRVRMTSAHTIYGVCSAGSANFYHAQGYKVLPPETTLRTTWGSTPVEFPIEGDAQWFTKSLTEVAVKGE